MKLDYRKLFRLAATGAAGCALANAAHAAARLTGTDLGNNLDVPASHGSYLADTPNIGVTWEPIGSGGWQTYSDGGWTNASPLNETGTGVYQVDGATTGKTYHIILTPDTGHSAMLSSIDFNVYNGGGDFNIEWAVTGSSSGTLGSGTHLAPTDANSTLDFGGLTGNGSESLTLALTIGAGSGTGSYLAVDNLAFDQVDSDSLNITHFTSDKEYVDNPVTLSWSIANPDAGMSVTLDDGTTPVDVTGSTNPDTGDGSFVVHPTGNTTYTLSVGGGNSMELTVLLGEALSLASSPNLAIGPAYETTLSWEVRPADADVVTIFDGTTTIDVTADTDPLTGVGSRAFVVQDASTTFEVDANHSGHTARTTVLREQSNSSALSIEAAAITTDGTLTVSWTGAAAGPTDWIGIYKLGDTPGIQFSTQWNYLNGTKTAGEGPADGSLVFSGLPEGDYFVLLLLDDGYETAQGPIVFTVTPPVEEVIRVVAVTRSGSELTLEWESKAGHEYDIFASDTLEGDPQFDWEIVDQFWPSAGDGTTSYTEDLGTTPPARRFYQVYEFELPEAIEP